ncbi:uncharacterized protein RCO7_01569 [Rhynchosporium graminicola]|uniref:Uncharacterized protein n=1 Tax=Rhynchosporium graminicola TaxID=2792576 RepID=A0A1E1JZN4_9HELO|nr:uncharacterized protein RCO7_01569 [Rhynchosporium commune]
MPSSSKLLLFSFATSLTNARPWTGAEQTNVYREAGWSPAPTPLPNVPAYIFKRASLDVNICGWIGGNSRVPALCSAGSSCIHDTIHGIVGCCATNGPCTQGVYTSCVDKNSVGWVPNEGLQKNGIYSCSGDAVCYRNAYPGGYYQYGCGASQDATSVQTTYAGQPSDLLLQVVFTGVTFSPFSTMATTTSASKYTATSSSSSISSSSSTSSRSSSVRSSTSTSSECRSATGSSTLKAAEKATPTAVSSPTSVTAEVSVKKESENKGVIACAVLGSIFGLAAIVGFALWWGRRKRNKRIDNRAGSFITQHQQDTPPTSGPFQRIAPFSPYEFMGMSRNQSSATTATANQGEANVTGVISNQYDNPNVYVSVPYQPMPPRSPPPYPRTVATLPDSEVGEFQTLNPPPPPATASTFLVSPSEIDDFSRGYNDAIASRSQERDTHIHIGDMPVLMPGVVAPMLLRGGSGSSTSFTASRRRSQDWGVTTEALRAQRPRVVSTPIENQPAGWIPRGLSMRASGSLSGTGIAGRGRTEERGGSRSGNGSPEWAIPPRSPLRSARPSRQGHGNGRQRYQLVDEVVDDVPILRSPGLRAGRGMRRESIKE